MTTNPVIDQLRSQRDEARDTAITLAEADNFDPESESFRELEARSASLDTQIERLSNLLNARASADALDGKLSKIQRRSEDTKQATETRESSRATCSSAPRSSRPTPVEAPQLASRSRSGRSPCRWPGSPRCSAPARRST
jgi:hypothetical protein